MTDLASLPARVRIITPAPSIYPGIDHVSVQYQTGWDATSLIQISGTATATNTLNFLVGNQALAVSVTTGDTPLTVSQGILAAMAAYPSLPAAAILTPSMVQLRGSNPIVTIGNVPSGLTVTNTAPASEIPASIAQAIKLGSKWMYDQVVSSAFNASAYGEDLPPFFYHMLQQWKEWSFA
jgi:phage tail sheath gpL-like